MQGSYNSLPQRATLESTAGQNYNIKLWTFYNEAHIPILSDLHNLQIRCYIDTSANIVSQSTGTGTGAATINYSNVILKVMKIPSDIATTRLNAMIKKAEHSFFYNFRYSPFAINNGVSQTTIVLSPFVGNVVALFFTVSPVALLVQHNAYQFTAISNFAILDSTSSNCVGGQPIPSFLALNYLGLFYSKGSYSSETSSGHNIIGTVIDNKANCYCWALSSNLPEAIQKGLLLGHRKFIGNEQLQITFTGSLGAAEQIDVWA